MIMSQTKNLFNHFVADIDVYMKFQRTYQYSLLSPMLQKFLSKFRLDYNTNAQKGLLRHDTNKFL